jgi:hypothetical protein
MAAVATWKGLVAAATLNCHLQYEEFFVTFDIEVGI